MHNNLFELEATDSNQVAFREHFSKVLRNFLKRGDQKLLTKQFAAYLNVDERAVRKWLLCDTEPTAFKIWLMAKKFGHEFLIEAFEDNLGNN